MNAAETKNIVLVMLATAGGFIANLIGGWDTALQVLLTFMAADIVTGLIVAAFFKNSPKTDSKTLESKAMLKGLFRKFSTLIIVIVATQLDKMSGTVFVRSAVVLFFCGSEGLSILENVGLMGVPFPDFLKNALAALKEKKDDPQ